jgi:hypothetical protein
MKPAYESLTEFMTDLENYQGGWQSYRSRFFDCSPEQRIIEMSAFDRLLQDEHKVTREHAEFVTRRRELSALDSLLRRAGR